MCVCVCDLLFLLGYSDREGRKNIRRSGDVTRFQKLMCDIITVPRELHKSISYTLTNLHML